MWVLCLSKDQPDERVPPLYTINRKKEAHTVPSLAHPAFCAGDWKRTIPVLHWWGKRIISVTRLLPVIPQLERSLLSLIYFPHQQTTTPARYSLKTGSGYFFVKSRPATFRIERCDLQSPNALSQFPKNIITYNTILRTSMQRE